MREVREITHKDTWDSFLRTITDTSYPLFQTWEWGEVQRTLGFSVVRFGLYENVDNHETVVSICQVIVINARRGHYLHLRHGPVMPTWNQQHFLFFIDYLKSYAKQQGATFLRVSPLLTHEMVSEQFFKTNGFIPSQIHRMDAEICWVLSLDKEKEALLQEMRKSHRYLIKKALTMQDLEIEKTTDQNRMSAFLPLYNDLSKRKEFVPHRGVAEEFAVFGKEGKAILFLAKYKTEVIAGALILFVGNMAVYHHAASLAAFRDIPASYLLQWVAIQEAKERGLHYYNFWGIAPEDNPNHPWKGLTLFKKGFGGQQKEFIHAHDLPLSIKYWKTYAIERAFKYLKGY